MKQTTIFNKKIHVTLWGEKYLTDHPFVAIGLHGLGGNAESTFHKLGSLAELHQLPFIAFDFPGFGFSAPLPPSAQLLKTITQLIEDIRLFFKINKISLIAHSMGGIPALNYIDQFSQNVYAFFSLEGNCIPGGGFLSTKLSRLSVEEAETFLHKLINRLEHNPRQTNASVEFINSLKMTTGAAMKIYSEMLVQGVPHDLFRNASSLIDKKFYIFTSESPEGKALAEHYEREKYILVSIPDSTHDLINSTPKVVFNTIYRIILKEEIY